MVSKPFNKAPKQNPQDAIAYARENAPSRSTDDEICPVCKSSRYLNPNMRFLVNPECYHKMCESCVDRIFSLGPAQCPVIGCGKTLRKAKFRKQTFEDITVEREVDVRRRVAKTFNKRQADFETLLAYNNYLEEVEDITFNLINNIDLPETEAKLVAYEANNKSLIQQNAARAIAEAQALALHKEHTAQQVARMHALDLEDEVAEKRERLEEKVAIAKALEHGNEDAASIVERVRTVHLKKSSMRRQNQEQKARELAAAMNAPAFTFAGLKMDEDEDAESMDMFDPLDGMEVDNQYIVYRDTYENPWLEVALTDRATQAGGYVVSQYCQRAIFEAFSGIGCFLEDHSSADVTMTQDVEIF